ncbi:MAG: glycosyl hydrolase family 65 protein [Chloroflexota bacterium]
MQKTSAERTESVREENRAAAAALSRPFKIIAFDWDGTAVVDRHADALPVRNIIERLLELGVYIVVVTGTNFQNVDRQLSSAIHGPHKRRLFILTNRGSEVYGFADDSHPALLWQRVASPVEEQKLTEIADAVRDTVAARTGLRFDVVYDRLNRRKIDVIPEPEWSNPPKSMIGDLLQAVESRLVSGGLPGGLREAYQLTLDLATAKGLPAVRITSDVKHIEVGLTDKEDAIRWLMGELAHKAAIPATDVLIAGDEFGPIAGFEGSDYKMFSPLANGATYISVGREPNGVPPGVLHVGGGPEHFLAVLTEQVELHARLSGTPFRAASRIVRSRTGDDGRSATSPPVRANDLVADPNWVLVEEGYEPTREHEIESLFTVANGYVGVRGSLPESVRESRPATVIAGIFDKPSAEVTELVVAPDWTRLRIFVAGEEVRLYSGETLSHRRLLDLRRGTFLREWRHRDQAGRITRLSFTRFVSLANRRAWLQSLTIVPENYSATVAVENVVDGRVINTAHGIRHLEALPPVEASPPNGRQHSDEASSALVLRARTRQSGLEIAYAQAGVLHAAEPLQAEHSVAEAEGLIGERWQWEARLGTPYRFDKLVATATSRETDEPAILAVEELERLVKSGLNVAFAAHAAAWGERWQASDVRLPGHKGDQMAARFAVHHLIQSANPDDERVSIGARGLTGEAYKGHVFWDTDIYVIPFFTFTQPEAARALLMYRYHTLPGARAKARELGYRGALYAWESADTGEEVTPRFALGSGGEVIPILTGEQEHHISADVAFATWQYWRATSDDDFFRRAGAEILLDTARFWASRARPGDDGRHHILEVIGPDEFHEGVDDNAFTNVMAQWNIERGLEAVALLRERSPRLWADLASRLDLREEELSSWRAVAEGMYTGFDPATGLFEQFRGYYDLEYIDLSPFEPRTASMEVLIGRERLKQSQIIKQSDVVMLMYLLWDRFPAAVREANFRYYAPRCAHGSSLSPSIHALMAARIGDLPLARQYFRQAAAIDLANNMGNASGGVHTACQGGLWQALVFGFGGLRVHDEGLSLVPQPLPEWQDLGFALQWQGRRLSVSAGASPRSLELELVRGAALSVGLGEPSGPPTVLEPGKCYGSALEGGEWRPLQERRR